VTGVLEIALSNAAVSAVLAVVALAAGSMCRRRPALVHGLWLLVLLKLLTPPLVRIPLNWPEQSPAQAPVSDLSPVPETEPAEPQVVLVEIVPPAGPAAPRAKAPAQEPPVAAEAANAPEAAEALALEEPPMADWPWREMLVGVWLSGSCGWLALASWRLSCFRRLLRHAQLAPHSEQERVSCLSRCLGLQRCPQVWLLPGRVAPLLWSLAGRPRLFLPAGLPAQLSREMLDTILVHELAHLRRRDHWVRHVELLAMALYWWHPAVWYARRALREAEEQCCDAWVVATLPGAGRTYANALVDTLDFLSGEGPVVPLAASGLGPVSDLKRRLTMILSERTPRTLGWLGGLGLLTAAVLLLPCLPVWGQSDEESQAREAEQEAIIKDAQARLQAMEADLKKRQVEMEEAAVRLKKAYAQLEQVKAKAAAGQAKKKATAEIEFGKQKAKPEGGWEVHFTNVKRKPHVSVIVRFDGEDAAQMKELIGRMRKVLPESASFTVVDSSESSPQHYVKDPKSGKYIISVEQPKAIIKVNPDGTKSEAKPGAGQAIEWRWEYRPVAPVPAPPIVRPPVKAPGNPGSDPRIDQLEKRLERMERILERLDRRQSSLDQQEGKKSTDLFDTIKPRK
jgi:beta-lactamase regulating signal transducer with metallopeptidase domain